MVAVGGGDLAIAHQAIGGLVRVGTIDRREQSKALAELESDGKLHLSLVYRGTPANSAKFIEAQDKVVAALYPAEPVQDSAPESQEPEESTASEAPAESEVQ